MWLKSLANHSLKEAMRYLHVHQWMVQLWPESHINWKHEWLYHPSPPSLRNNTCLCVVNEHNTQTCVSQGPMWSLCTYGNTEAWGNVYHGSVPPCPGATQSSPRQWWSARSEVQRGSVSEKQNLNKEFRVISTFLIALNFNKRWLFLE